MELYNKLNLYGNTIPINFKVQTISERDSIPNTLREIGQTCYVINDDRTYRLKNGIDNINWIQDIVSGIVPATDTTLGGVKIGAGITVTSDGTISVDLTGIEGIKGEDGQDGKDGVDGKDGKDGENGLSAFELAVEEGFIGTVLDWLASLRGKDGVDGKDGTNGEDGKDGKDGTNGIDGKDGKDGINGKSAYEIALDNDFEGTIEEWLESLNGKDGIDGTNGKSAYDIAVDGGFEGTKVEWLESLVGANGKDGKDGTNGIDGQDGADGQDGKDGTGVNILGSFNTLEELQTAHPSGNVGDAYLIEGNLYVWASDKNEWLNVGNIQGPAGQDGINGTDGQDGKDGIDGAKGADGQDGKSAYQLATEQGFSGTLDEWLKSLNGKDGINGEDGLSAYKIATNNGFEGTETEWLESLKGAKGEQGEKGLTGDTGAKGEDGKSAYQIWLDEDNTGTEQDFLDSLVGSAGERGQEGIQGPIGLTGEQGIAGPQGIQGIQGEQGIAGVDGEDGKSAYQIAVDEGFEGTETQWLASLKGERGEQGPKGEDGVGFKDAPSDGEIYGRQNNQWAAIILPEQKVDIIYLASEDGYAIMTETVPTSNQEILPMTWFPSDPGVWHDILDIVSDSSIQDKEIEFKAGNRFSIKMWLFSDIARNNAQIRISAIDATDNTILASATTMTNLPNNTPAPIPIVFENVHIEDRTLQMKDLVVRISINTPEFGTQIRIVSLIPDEISYIIHNMIHSITVIGERGENGLSAYQVAVEEGFEGTVEEWLESLRGQDGEQGPKGDTGDQGPAGNDGTTGSDGEDGLSAYELAVKEGFEGSLQEWLDSLVGPKGEDGSAADLPIASDTILGGIKVGNNLTIDEDGTLNAEAGGTEYELPIASDIILGGVKIGDNISISADGTITVKTSGVLNKMTLWGPNQLYGTTINYTPDETGTGKVRNIWMNESNPTDTDGINGDIWIKI